MRATWIAVGLIGLASPTFALSLAETLAQIDRNYTLDQGDRDFDRLVQTLTQTTVPSDRAEILWRLARLMEARARDLAKQPASNARRQTILQQGADFAQQAIAANPLSAVAYFWKAANLGQWAEANGGFEALPRLTEVRDAALQAYALAPNLADNCHLLAQLYAKVPGWPLSFADIDRAIFFETQAVAATANFKSQIDHWAYSLALAELLWQRNRHQGSDDDRTQSAQLLRRLVNAIGPQFAADSSAGRLRQSAIDQAKDWGIRL